MTRSVTANIAASVQNRLSRLARERGEDVQLVLLRYANERLMFRLACSKYASQFVLKGAALFTLWTRKPHRATRDLDLLGFGDPGERHIHEVFLEILALGVEEDGVQFDLDSLSVGPIREQQDYGGVRVELVARLMTARVRLQVDVAFGDAITPEATMVEFPPLLDFPAPRLRAYPRETVVAEKLEAIVRLGMVNSRMKDFYDLVVLANMFDFDGPILERAIRATFERRKTSLPGELPIALTDVFTSDPTKTGQWSGFARKAGVDNAGTLSQAAAAIVAFIQRPLLAASSAGPPSTHWQAGGPWR